LLLAFVVIVNYSLLPTTERRKIKRIVPLSGVSDGTLRVAVS
jgi:hypothetical protein